MPLLKAAWAPGNRIPPWGMDQTELRHQFSGDSSWSIPRSKAMFWREA
jgi:hypothetical protein